MSPHNTGIAVVMRTCALSVIGIISFAGVRSDAITINTLSPGKMSTARRNLAGVAVSPTQALFAGGCVADVKGGSSVPSQFDCGQASAVIDAVNSTGLVVGSATLGEPRSWIAGCSPAPGIGAFAGGGLSGAKPHSPMADVVSENLTVSTNPSGISIGRWGMATVANGSSCFFAGGKVTIDGYQNAYTTNLISQYDASKGEWRNASFGLSIGRESTVGLNIGGSLLAFAAGWMKSGGHYLGCENLDMFKDQNAVGGGRLQEKYISPEYDMGVAAVGSTGYIVDSSSIYSLSAEGSLSTVASLPPALKGSSTAGGTGAIPQSHIPQNGVTIGNVICFYGIQSGDRTGALYCYDTVTSVWSKSEATTAHVGGAIVALGHRVLVAGGYDPATNPLVATDVIDVFELTSS